MFFRRGSNEAHGADNCSDPKPGCIRHGSASSKVHNVIGFTKYFMANPDTLKLFLTGSDKWNASRVKRRDQFIDLSDIDFHAEITAITNDPYCAEIDDYDFSSCNLNRASFRNCYCSRTKFDGSWLHFSDLVDGYFLDCSFVAAELQVSKIGSAKFINCDFTGAKLSYCSAEETDFNGSILRDTAMDNMSLVATDFTGATLEGCSVYGISAWNLILEETSQSNLFISKDFSGISVPSATSRAVAPL